MTCDYRPAAASSSPSSLSFSSLLALLLVSLGCYWLVASGVIYGVVQLSGASIEYRSAVHAVTRTGNPAVACDDLQLFFAQAIRQVLVMT
jgi:hypothetical protein